jgi:hypothetical protein
MSLLRHGARAHSVFMARAPQAAMLSNRAGGASALPPAVPARRGGYLEAWLSTFDNARAGIAR